MGCEVTATGRPPQALWRLFRPLASHPLFLSLVVVGALFAAFLSFACPRFETNDDPGMMQIAMGSDFFPPAEQLVYINVVLGLVLKTLYSWTRSVNWYTLALYLVHGISMVALLYVLVRKRPSGLGWVAFGLVFSLFELRFLMNLQFTSTAFVAAQSGALLILAGALVRGRGRWRVVAAGVVLFILGALVRTEAAYLVGAIGAPLFLFVALKARSWVPVVVLAVALVVSVGTSAYNDWSYTRDDKWREFFNHNRVSSALHAWVGIPSDEETESVLEGIGWSENDLALFFRWFPADPVVYSEDNLRTLVSSINRFKTRRTWGEAWEYLGEQVDEAGGYLTFVGLTLIVCLLVPQIEKRRALWVCLGVPGSALACSIYLAWMSKLPPRVFLPILFMVSVASWFTVAGADLANPPAHRASRRIPLARAVIGMAIAGLYVWVLGGQFANVVSEHRMNRVLNQAYVDLREDFRRAFELDDASPPTFVLTGGGYPTGWGSPLWRPDEYLQFRSIRYGWSAYFPPYNQVLDDLSTGSAYEALLYRDDVYLMARRGLLELIGEFVREHYGSEVDFRAVYVPPSLPVDPEMQVYKLELRGPAGSV